MRAKSGQPALANKAKSLKQLDRLGVTFHRAALGSLEAALQERRPRASPSPQDDGAGDARPIVGRHHRNDERFGGQLMKRNNRSRPPAMLKQPRQNAGRSKPEGGGFRVEAVFRKLPPIAQSEPRHDRTNIVQHGCSSPFATVNYKMSLCFDPARLARGVRGARVDLRIRSKPRAQAFPQSCAAARAHNRQARCALRAMVDSGARRRRSSPQGLTRYMSARFFMRPVTDLGELMTKDSYRASMRPLVLTAAWFTFLASAAFAWADIESHKPLRPTASHAIVAPL